MNNPYGVKLKTEEKMLMRTGKKTEGNLMAGQDVICPVLQGYYVLPAAKKMKHIKTPWAVMLLDSLPGKVRKILLEGFLSGAHGKDVKNWRIVYNYFQRNSQIIPALTVNPGTYTMLERMYHCKTVGAQIDQYFKMSIAGGQALFNRYQAINSHGIKHVNKVLQKQDECMMIDIGSGPGRNGIDMCVRSPIFRKHLKIECIDIDSDAIKKGQMLVDHYGFKNISFLNKSMMKLGDRYGDGVDYGLLIGVLCGMVREDRVGLLKVLKSYFKPGAKMVAASLLERMAKVDLLCAYLLRETTGWGLKYTPTGELKKVFEEAGWIYKGYFQDEPTRLYEIGVAIAP